MLPTTKLTYREAMRILRYHPGARLVLVLGSPVSHYWVVPGGVVPAPVAWRLIQKLEVADRGLFQGHPQSWQLPGIGHRTSHHWSLGKTLAQIKEMEMDISKHLSARYVKFGDHEDGPARAIITDVQEGQRYGRPELCVEYVANGKRGILSLNTGNLERLSHAWGPRTEVWIGFEVEFEDGQATFSRGEVDSVIVRPISPPLTREQREAAVKSPSKSSPKKSSGSSRPDSEIPFKPERR